MHIQFSNYESFRALKLSNYESFRALKLSNRVNFSALKLSKLATESTSFSFVKRNISLTQKSLKFHWQISQMQNKNM